ncbi:MAG: hypothetical protein K0Q79_1375 [Flavipsychrobacter sp.]|jgi:hypothetical protein|nr:hypothetical protein [Flavipsychrobacter sp.]
MKGNFYISLKIFSNPQKFTQMNTSYAKGLVSNYKNNQWAIINSNFLPNYDIRDSRCVWFSIDELQGFLDSIKQPNAQEVNATGVRIYFGAYSTDTPGAQANYNHLHTLLMIATHSAADGKNYDFDAATGRSDFANLQMITALNQGHLVPPPFNVDGPSNMYQQGNLFMDYADNS